MFWKIQLLQKVFFHTEITGLHTVPDLRQLPTLAVWLMGNPPLMGQIPRSTERIQVVVYPSGNAVGQIKEVTLRQARLVLGWVTVYGRVNHLGSRYVTATEVGSAFYPPWDGKMSISFRAD